MFRMEHRLSHAKAIVSRGTFVTNASELQDQSYQEALNYHIAEAGLSLNSCFTWNISSLLEQTGRKTRGF